MRKLAVILCALLLALCAVSPALAHKLKVFATTIGDTVEGRVYFVGGGAGIGVPVTLTNSSGEVVATGRTEAPDGSFALSLPYRDDFTVSADAQDGHVGSFSLSAVRLAETLPARPGADLTVPDVSAAPSVAEPADAASVSTAAVEVAVARQLAPLLDEIDALRSAIGFRDMIGGVGFILGGFGLWAFIAARGGRK
jgi:nickel transport protein